MKAKERRWFLDKYVAAIRFRTLGAPEWRGSYFDSWQDAHEALLVRTRMELSAAANQVRNLKARLKKYHAMKPPAKDSP